MQLDANGTVTREAGATDVARALESRPHEGDWSITLEDADGSYLQAYAAEGGKYRLTSRAGEVQTDGVDEMDEQAAGQVLRQYLSGDPAWRKAMDWKGEPTGKVTAALRDVFTDASKGPELQPTLQSAAAPASAGSAMGGFIGLGVAGLIVYGAITKGPGMIAEYFPRAESDPRLLVLVGCMGLFALLLGLASLVVAMRARSWPSAAAEVISSKVEEGTSWITAGGSRSDSRTFVPKVEYRYTVDGNSYLCQQVRLGVVLKSRAEEVVAKYPVGARVVAYYDAGNPKRAFLEYSLDAPLIAFTFAVVFGAAFAHLVGLF